MIVTLRTPIGDIVAKQPRAGAVFERCRIDYCCEGERSLEEACARAGTDAALVLKQIHLAASAALDERDWTVASLAELCEHIVSVHHSFLVRAVADYASWLDEATADPREALSEVPEGWRIAFGEFRDGLEAHLRLEEERIFPAIVRAERARLADRSRPAAGPGRLRDDIPRLVGEHRLFDEGMRSLQGTIALHEAPGSSPPTVFRDLSTVAADLHRHLHLENNILFPRALALEAAYA